MSKKELKNLFAIQQTRMGEATKLWQEATGKTETLPDLGDLLDWLMERAESSEHNFGVQLDATREAERVHREMIDLLEVITEESNETYPEMAVTDAVRLLKREKEEAEHTLQDANYDAFKYHIDCAEESRRLKEAEADINDVEQKLKEATDALKGIANIKYEYAPCYLFIEDAKKALADIEGEKRAGFKVTPTEPKDYGDYPPDYGDIPSVEGKKERDIPLRHLPETDLPGPDWDFIEQFATPNPYRKDDGAEYLSSEFTKAILYLKEKIDKNEIEI